MLHASIRFGENQLNISHLFQGLNMTMSGGKTTSVKQCNCNRKFIGINVHLAPLDDAITFALLQYATLEKGLF